MSSWAVDIVMAPGSTSVAAGATPRRSKRNRSAAAAQAVEPAQKKRSVVATAAASTAAGPPHAAKVTPPVESGAEGAAPPRGALSPASGATTDVTLPSLDRETVVQAAGALLALRARQKGKKQSMMVDSGDEGDGSEGGGDGDAEEDIVSVVMTLKRAGKRAVLKPRTVPLVHPLFTAGEDDVCLFVKDPQRLVKDHLADAGVSSVTKVLGVSKLEKRYGTHEAKRELAQMYDLFLVDDRVVKMMPRLLGNTFIRGKKMPLVIRMDRNIGGGIEKALRSTSFAPGTGTTCSVRVARASFSAAEIADNVVAAMGKIVSSLPGGWSAVQSLYVKSKSSPSLPIFASLPTASDFVATGEERKAQAAAERKKRSADRRKAAKVEQERKERQERLRKKQAKALARSEKVSAAERMLSKKKADDGDGDLSDDSDVVGEVIMQSFEAGEAESCSDFDDGEAGEDDEGEDVDRKANENEVAGEEEENSSSDDEKEEDVDKPVAIPQKRKSSEKRLKKANGSAGRAKRSEGSGQSTGQKKSRKKRVS